MIYQHLAFILVPRAGTSHRNHRKNILLIINNLHISYFRHFAIFYPFSVIQYTFRMVIRCITIGKIQGKPKFAVKHNRRKENLSLYLIDNTPAERQQNKETLDLAMHIRAEREQEFKKVCWATA